MIRERRTIECSAILFDLDGVLIDSTSCILRHWQEWAERQYLDIEKIRQVAHGLRTVETMRLVAPNLDVEGEAERFTIQEVADTEGVVAIDGAERILASIPEGLWGLVTSGGLELVKARMKAAGLPVPKILVTGDDVIHGKPDPEPYLVGADRLGFDPGQILVIEDAPAGVTAGKKAGMRVLGIASTHRSEELLERGADYVVDKLMDMTIENIPEKSCLLVRMK